MIETRPEGQTYNTVAASQTAQVLGSVGVAGAYLSKVILIPATTSPGVVTLLDGATSIPLFVGGATSFSNLVPQSIDINARCVTQWKITTGANISVIAVGVFDGSL